MSIIREQTLEIFKKLDITDIEAQDLEIGIYNFTIDYGSKNKIPLNWSSDLFQECYLSKARSVYLNMSRKNYLIDKIKNKEIIPHEIADMKPHKLDPECWEGIIEAEMNRNKAAYEVTKVAMTDQIVCGKCKGRKISYYELQTRSADEPVTTYMSCLTCGNKWRM